MQVVEKALVLNLGPTPDSSGDIIDVDADVELSKHLIMVTEQFCTEKVIGTAHLHRVGDRIMGDFFFPEAEIEKLRWADGREVPIVPCVAGRILKREDQKITAMRIESIGLFPDGKNCDPTIPALVFQIEAT